MYSLTKSGVALKSDSAVPLSVSAARRLRPVRAASVETTNNAAEARAWIEAWRNKQAAPVATTSAAGISGTSGNASEARAWIEAWRSKQGSGANGSQNRSLAKPKVEAGEMITFTAEQLDAVNLEDALKKLSK
mmetsp:Transcript_36791/g.87410  ORF Transcript_36791/g.87410 Transcript_36791/m.87410 type:complete len:133 (+) Transcript_36791:190-588(+)